MVNMHINYSRDEATVQYLQYLQMVLLMKTQWSGDSPKILVVPE